MSRDNGHKITLILVSFYFLATFLPVSGHGGAELETKPREAQPGALVPGASNLTIKEFPVPRGSHPHDAAPAPDGTVWYTAQAKGELGRLDPLTGKTRHIPLGRNSSPHGVIVGPDGAPWITDSGLNAIVRVDPVTEAVKTYPLPEGSGYANLNTATFDRKGTLWFTGQSGVYGSLDVKTGKVAVYKAPKGRGPYGIATAPDGSVWYASLAGSYIARIDTATGKAEVFDPPTKAQGSRRVWPDSKNRIWVSEWSSGKLGLHDPVSGKWKEWLLPGKDPAAYAVYVDEADSVWVSDFGANALVRFLQESETFEVFRLPSPNSQIRQILGRRGEVWGAGSRVDKLIAVYGL